MSSLAPAVTALTAFLFMALGASSGAQPAVPTAPAEGVVAPAAAAPTEAAVEVVQQARGQDVANESPRERGRALLKRNPIASEYQVPGELGRSPGAAADGEGVDYQVFFPGQSLFNGAPRSLRTKLEVNYNSLSENAEPGGSFAAKQVFDEQWAAAVQLSTSASYRNVEHLDQPWEPLDGVKNLNGEDVYFLERPRISQDTYFTRFNVARAQVEFKPSEDQTFYFRAAAEDYYDRFIRNRLELQIGNGTITAPDLVGDTFMSEETTLLTATSSGAGTRRYFGDTVTERTRWRFTLGGETDFEGGGGIDYSAYYHKWDIDEFWWDWNFNDRVGGSTSVLDVTYRPLKPGFTDFTILAAGTDQPFDLLQTDTALLQSLRLHDESTVDEDQAARIDLDKPFAMGSEEVWLSAGAVYRTKERKAGEIRDVYGPDASSRASLTEVGVGKAPGKIVENTYNHPAGLHVFDSAEYFYNNVGEEFFFREADSILEGERTRYTTQETVSSFYGLVSWEGERWAFDAGIRGEFTETDTLGRNVIEESLYTGQGTEVQRVAGNVIYDVGAKNDYWNFLPNVAASYDLTDTLTLRGTIFQQLMRPQYFDIVSYERVSIPTRSISLGNPDLQPTTITNYRLALDYVTPAVGELSVEIYYVDIKDFFYGSVRRELRPEFGAGTFTISNVENGDSGNIYGFQAQWTRSLDFIPGFQGTELAVYYTFSEHESEITGGRTATLWLPDRSKHLLQTTLDGRWGPWGAGAEFSFQSRALDDIGETAADDGYREEVITTALNGSYRFAEGWTLSATLFNFVNHPERNYSGEPERVGLNQYSDWYVVLGVEYQM